MDLWSGTNETAAFVAQSCNLRRNWRQFPASRDTSKGRMNQMKATLGTFRNPTVHSPKIAWAVTERDALEALTLLSMLHRRLDQAVLTRGSDPSDTLGTAEIRTLGSCEEPEMQLTDRLHSLPAEEDDRRWSESDHPIVSRIARPRGETVTQSPAETVSRALSYPQLQSARCDGPIAVVSHHRKVQDRLVALDIPTSGLIRSVCGQDPVHRALRAQVLLFVQKRRDDLGRRAVDEARRGKRLQDAFSFVLAQGYDEVSTCAVDADDRRQHHLVDRLRDRYAPQASRTSRSLGVEMSRPQ